MTCECPKPARLLSLVICAATALSAVGGVVLGIVARSSDPFLWAFESVVLISSAGGVWAGLGKIRGAEAMAMFCTGGVVFVAAVLSAPALVTGLLQGGTGLSAQAGGINLVPWVLVRLLAAAALISLSGLVILLRSPRKSGALLLIGILTSTPVIALGAFVWLGPGRSAFASLDPAIQVFLASIGFIVIAALIAVSGHHVIRAFEIGIEANANCASTQPVRSEQSSTATPANKPRAPLTAPPDTSGKPVHADS